MAEGADGLGTEKCIEIGRQYKRGDIDAVTKNQWVLTGKDSLFKTFRLAIDNFASGYANAQSPKPPKTFKISGEIDTVRLSWDLFEEDPNIVGHDIYRTSGEYDNPFKPAELIYESSEDETSYNDVTPVRGVGQYYNIVTVYNNGQTSNRYSTQSYDPAYMTRGAGKSLTKGSRIVPNPFILSSHPDRLRFQGEPDKLAFFNIPGQCTIQIYTEIGELINTIEHTTGTADEY